MTKTTKEQRAAASLYIEKHTALQTTFPAEFVLALLSDSERLAAIEAVTGPEVRKLVALIERRGLLLEAIPTLLFLSAKVADQAEDIERLRVECAKLTVELNEETAAWEGHRALTQRAEAAEAKCKELEDGITQDQRDLARQVMSVCAERDTLRRLLTETAVPALENMAALPNRLGWSDIGTTPGWTAFANAHVDTTKSALSTIRAQMDSLTAAPRPARCSTCDDTRIIYGHGGIEASCPACYASDAEAGLAMLGGDGR